LTLEELLQILAVTAKEQGTATPYIVGGVPRNIVLDQLDEIKDIDITTGDSDVNVLAEAFALKLKKSLRTTGKHKSLIYGGVSFDFSTNFVYGNIEELVKEHNVKNPNDLTQETYSRDFTTNTLLLDLDLKSITDITGHGRLDTLNKILRCPVDCSTSFAHDPKRMLRAFHMRASYGFRLSDEVKDAIMKNASLLKTIKPQYSSQMLNNIARKNPDVLDELIEMGIMKDLPLTKYITEVLLSKRKILDVL
jgi:tRNA nucleotidyltransferase/poly(A) polymerase